MNSDKWMLLTCIVVALTILLWGILFLEPIPFPEVLIQNAPIIALIMEVNESNPYIFIEEFLDFGEGENKNFSHVHFFYGYSTIYLNKTTPAGINNLGVDFHHRCQGLMIDFAEAFRAGDCDAVIALSNKISAREFIGLNDYQCEHLNACGFELRYQLGDMCLYVMEAEKQIFWKEALDYGGRCY